MRQAATNDDEEQLPLRKLYHALASRGWLAVDWPQEFGGLGLTALDAGVVAEEMALHGVPDTIRVNTIDNVGNCILAHGTDAQRYHYLPRMAAGDLIAAVLFTEPNAGSDLAALTTTAAKSPNGWTLNGSKVWIAQCAIADVGLCAARTDPESSGYEGLTVFLIPMEAPGVVIERIPTLSPDPVYSVELQDAEVPPDRVLGEVNAGWELITEGLALERSGLIYYGRGRRWLDAVTRELVRSKRLSPDAKVRLAEFDARLECGRCLAWETIASRVEAHRIDPMASAMSKWYNSSVAREVASVALDLLGSRALLPADDPEALLEGMFELAYREAPTLTLAAGTSEMMLHICSEYLMSRDG